MGEIIGKAIFLIVFLPFLMFQKGYEMFKDLMNEKHWWWMVPYILLGILVFLLIVLWSAGYR